MIANEDHAGGYGDRFQPTAFCECVVPDFLKPFGQHNIRQFGTAVKSKTINYHQRLRPVEIGHARAAVEGVFPNLGNGIGKIQLHKSRASLKCVCSDFSHALTHFHLSQVGTARKGLIPNFRHSGRQDDLFQLF